MNIEDVFSRYGLYYSEEGSLDDKIASLEKLYFFLNEEDSLVKKKHKKLKWNKQIKKGVEGAHHPSPINKRKLDGTKEFAAWPH